MEKIGKDLLRLWDEQKFAPADVLDFVWMAERLKPHLAKYAAAIPIYWLTCLRFVTSAAGMTSTFLFSHLSIAGFRLPTN
jgi:hypothetical protein